MLSNFFEFIKKQKADAPPSKEEIKYSQKDYDEFTKAISSFSDTSSQDGEERDFSVIEAISSQIPKDIQFDKNDEPIKKSFSNESILSNLTTADEKEEKELEESYREIKESLAEQEKQRNKPASEKTFVENVKDTIYYIKDTVSNFIETVGTAVKEKFQEFNDYFFQKPEEPPKPKVEPIVQKDDFLKGKENFDLMHEKIKSQMSEKSFVEEYEKEKEAKEQSPKSRGK